MSEYTIVLKNATAGEDSTNPISQNKTMSKDSSEKVVKGNKTAKNIIKGLVAYNSYVKPFVTQVVSHQVGTISLRTGAEEVEQRVQFGFQIAEQAVGIGASILTGFAIGNVPGAVAGAVIGVATTAMNYANKAAKIDLEQNLEDISLRGMTNRAGGYAPSYSGSRSGRQ